MLHLGPGKVLEFYYPKPVHTLLIVFRKRGMIYNWRCVCQVIKRLLERSMPACPKLNFAIVDVRDVAAAHIKAMTVPEAAGMSACLSVSQCVC